VYLGALVLLVGAGLIGGINFTAIGHIAAVAIGLCCRPLCRPTGARPTTTRSPSIDR
jgi:hypothetical protein